MKVKELKDQLNQLSDEDDVNFLMDSGCCGDYEEMEVYDLDLFREFKLLLVRFKALPGYRSCIQSGSTLKQDKEYWKDKNSDKG